MRNIDLIKKNLLPALPAAVILLAPGEVSAEKAAKPNILFVLADDCTYLDLELYGGQAKTPRINKFAKEGMTFNRCYQAAPMCSPTRHNLYTGIYPVKSGAYPNHTFANKGTKSIVQHLKSNGYRVALAGKTHIAPKSVFPFEYIADFENSYKKQSWEDEPRTGSRYPKIEKFVKECVKSKTPFCLFAASHDPHGPYERGDQSQYPAEKVKLSPEFVDTPQTREEYGKYLAEITFFDGQVGECLDILERSKLNDNTLVMVATEQGSSFPFAKWTCYENGVASGLVVRWPGKVKPSSKTDAIVEYCDVVPTLVEAAGANLISEVDGKSFLPVLLGEKTHHKKYSFSIMTCVGVNGNQNPYGTRSCVSENYRYIRNLTPKNPFSIHKSHAILKETKNGWIGEWIQKSKDGDKHAKSQLHRYVWRPGEELYDIKKDPYCLKNLAEDTKFTDVIKEHSEQLDAWMKDQGDKGAETEIAAKMRSKSLLNNWAGKKNNKKGKNPKKKKQNNKKEK
jgi:N-sulfoglucosamine sulfohydrolase